MRDLRSARNATFLNELRVKFIYFLLRAPRFFILTNCAPQRRAAGPKLRKSEPSREGHVFLNEISILLAGLWRRATDTLTHRPRWGRASWWSDWNLECRENNNKGSKVQWREGGWRRSIYNRASTSRDEENHNWKMEYPDCANCRGGGGSF